MIVNKKIKLKLIGLDGNAFCLMGTFSNQAKKEGWTKEEIESVLTECRSGDYDHLIRVLSEHCENYGIFDSSDYNCDEHCDNNDCRDCDDFGCQYNDGFDDADNWDDDSEENDDYCDSECDKCSDSECPYYEYDTKDYSEDNYDDYCDDCNGDSRRLR